MAWGFQPFSVQSQVPVGHSRELDGGLSAAHLSIALTILVHQHHGINTTKTANVSQERAHGSAGTPLQKAYSPHALTVLRDPLKVY